MIEPGPYEVRPLVLGITGHRDLRDRDLDALERPVAALIDTLRERYPATPLELHSALAEGADRLVARVALARGATLVAPLPFELERYERDFAEPASLREFRALLARAERWFALPPVPPDDAGEAPEGYERLGRYLAERSDLLLALWNGSSDAPKPGGTADVVRLRLDEGYGPVWHLVTPRRSDPETEGDPFVLRWRYPDAAPDPDRFRRELARRDARNRTAEPPRS